MDQLMVAVCEDRVEEEERLLAKIEASPVPTRVVLFSEADAFVEDYIPGFFDLVLMDIYLMREDGTESPDGVRAVKSVRAVDPQVPIAFITSSKDHALDAFRLDVLRYIEKPVTQEAVNDVLALAADAKHRQPGMSVRVDGQEVNVPYNRIVYLEQRGHYIELHLSGDQELRARGRISDAFEGMDQDQFVHCHKSYVANLNFVDDIKDDIRSLKMFGGAMVPMRRESMGEVRRKWEDWMLQLTLRKDVSAD